jgi:hypothetical protein
MSLTPAVSAVIAIGAVALTWGFRGTSRADPYEFQPTSADRNRGVIPKTPSGKLRRAHSVALLN